MGSKTPIDTSYRQACEYRKEGCLFNNDSCKHQRCGFYYRVNVPVPIEETIIELRLLRISEKKIKSLKDIVDPIEFRKQALFRFYRPL